MGQSKGSKKRKGRNKREFKCCHECGKFGLGVRSREASVFETSKRSLAEARCVDMLNVDLNALEIGAVLLIARSHKVQVGIDSCTAVTTSCKSCMDLSARKVKGKLRGVSFWYAGPKMAETCGVLVGGSGGSVRERHESRCVLPLLRRRYPSVCVLRGMWNETGTGVERSLRIPSLETADRSTNSPTLGIGKTTTRLPGLPPTMRDLDRVLSTRCAVLRSSGMLGTLNLQSRSSCPPSVSAPKVMSSNLNCCSFQSSEHREEWQCHVEEDS